MPTSAIKAMELSRKIFETKGDTAKLVDRNKNLVQELENVLAAERLA